MTTDVKIIDTVLLREVSGAAAVAPRRRRNLNLHRADTDVSHRLLNGVEPDSYVAPHRHMDPSKDETIVALKGRFGLVFFDELGNISGTAMISPGGSAVGVNIPHGVYHTLIALEPGSVFFESKAGPYLPLSPEERATWAPAEGSGEAPAYLESLRQLFA